MTEELLIQLMNQINDEHIVHGSCEVKFTFHDGRIEFYELTSHKRVNIGKGCTTGKDGTNGARKSALWGYSFSHKTKGLLLGLKRIL